MDIKEVVKGRRLKATMIYLHSDGKLRERVEIFQVMEVNKSNLFFRDTEIALRKEPQALASDIIHLDNYPIDFYRWTLSGLYLTENDLPIWIRPPGTPISTNEIDVVTFELLP